jgi:hypothetical protein
MIALIACVLFIVGTGALVVLAFVLGGQMEREFDEYNRERVTVLSAAGCDDELVREQLRAFRRVLE